MWMLGLSSFLSYKFICHVSSSLSHNTYEFQLDLTLIITNSGYSASGPNVRLGVA